MNYNINIVMPTYQQINGNGTCSETTNVTLIVGELLNTIGKEISNDINIYSFNNILYVSFSSELKGKVELDLYDITGQKVWETQRLTAIGQHEFSLSNLASGHYFVRSSTDNGMVLQRVFVDTDK